MRRAAARGAVGPAAAGGAVGRGAAVSFAGALAVAVAGGTLGPAGCALGDPGGSPEGAVSQLVASARAGDRAAVFARLGPRTRGRIDELLASGRGSGAARLLRPEDLVTVGWVPLAWEAANVHELRREGDEAEVEVVSAAGDRQTVRAVREGKRWTVELPLR